MLKALQGLTDPSQPDALLRVAGLFVSLELRRMLGQEEEALALMRRLEEFERTGTDPELKTTIAELRSAVSPSSNGVRLSESITPGDGMPDHQFLHLVERLMTTPA